MMLRTTNNPDRHLDLGPGAASGTGSFSGSLVVAESEAATHRRTARRSARRRLREVCGAWMPDAGERCARFAGHKSGPPGKGGEHRTRAALDKRLIKA